MTTLARLRNDKRVELVDDERECGDGIFITLKAGWSFDPFQDNRVASADSPTEAWEYLQTAAQPFHGTLTD